MVFIPTQTVNSFRYVFDTSKIKLSQIIDFVFNWCYETNTYHTLMRECQLASEATAKWRNLCRDICAEYFIRHPIAIGGPGAVVEIDESSFVRRKYHVGRAVNAQVGVWWNRSKFEELFSSCC